MEDKEVDSEALVAEMLAAPAVLGAGQEEIDRQMSPSVWSHRYGADKVIEEHCRILSEETKKAKDTHTWRRVAYGGDDEFVDTYLPAADVPRKTVEAFYIHGGMWQFLGIEDSGFSAKELVADGIALHAVEYTIAPQGSMTTIVDQVARAFAFLVKRCLSREEGSDDRGDAQTRFIIFGHSAGGHLAIQLQWVDWEKYGLTNAQVEERIAAIVSVSGLFDLRPVAASYANDALKLSADEIETFSPLLRIAALDSLTPPVQCKIWLLIAQHEPDEFRRHSIDYAKLLRASNQSIVFIDLEGEDHFSAIERLTERAYKGTDLLLRIASS